MQEDIVQIEAPETPAVVPAEQNGHGTPQAASARSMIVFEGVTKVYEPNVHALSDVSFVIDKGEFVFVVGASGSGKSTIIRLLLKELELDLGPDHRRRPRPRPPSAAQGLAAAPKRRVCLPGFQAPPPNRTAAENVAYALKVQGESTDSIRWKAPAVLNLVGLRTR